MASSTTSAALPCRPRSLITVAREVGVAGGEEADHRDQHEQQREQRQEGRQRDRGRQGSAADGAEAVVDAAAVVEPRPPPSPPLEVEHGGTVPASTRFGTVLPAGPRPERIPAHVACVMDGNGRWATRRGLKRTEGHAAGEEALFDTVEGALELGVALAHRLRLLHRELAPAGRRGALPHGLQRAPAAHPARRARRQGRAGAVHRPQGAGGCRSGCSGTSTTPRP